MHHGLVITVWVSTYWQDSLIVKHAWNTGWIRDISHPFKNMICMVKTSRMTASGYDVYPLNFVRMAVTSPHTQGHWVLIIALLISLFIVTMQLHPLKGWGLSMSAHLCHRLDTKLVINNDGPLIEDFIMFVIHGAPTYVVNQHNVARIRSLQWVYTASYHY